MKKNTVVFLIFAVIIASQAAAAPAGKNYKAALVLTQSGKMNSQFKNINDILAGLLKKRTGIVLDPVVMYDTDAVLKSARKGELDIIFTFNAGIAARSIWENGFSPLVSYRVFGQESKECLYMKTEKSNVKIKDLKGLKAQNYDGLIEYFVLRDLLGQPPENFFRTLKISDGLSSIYALALGEADVAFVEHSNIAYMKKTNPGSVKGIKEIACTEKSVFPLVFYSKTMPARDVDAIKQTMLDSLKSEEFKNFRPIMKMVEFEFINVEKKDFEPVWNLLLIGEKNGWGKDYDLWRKYADK